MVLSRMRHNFHKQEVIAYIVKPTPKEDSIPIETHIFSSIYASSGKGNKQDYSSSQKLHKDE